jgi:hypothetical protein
MDTPYELGRRDAASHAVTVELYNAKPPDCCPYAKGTAEGVEYDRGWNNYFAEERAAGHWL